MPSLDMLAEDWADLTGWTTGSSTTVSGGRLLAPFSPPGTGWATSTVTDWNLTGAAVAMPFSPPESTPGTQRLVLHTTADPDGDGLEWSLEGGEALVARYRAGDAWFTVATLDHDPLAHQWWRIRERGGLVTWDLSPDGLGWTAHGVWVPSIDVTALQLSLRADWSPDEGHIPPTGPAVFGALNIPPERIDPATVIAQDGVPFIAVDVQPDNITGTFQLDVSELDGPDRLGWSGTAAGLWENVVCDVLTVRSVRGAVELAGSLTVVDAGLLTITLSDVDRRFDPTENADAIHEGTPIRLRSWGYDLAGDLWEAVLFTGTIDAMPVRYLPDEAPQVVITASDLVAEFVAWHSAGRDIPVGAGDTLLGRAQRILAEMGQPATRLALDVDTHAYAASHPATVLAQPWDELVAAQDAELGRLWVDRDNRLVVRTRRSQLSGPVRGTLSDVHGDADPGTVHCCYRDPDAAHDTSQVTNRAVASRRVEETPPDPAVITVEDTASLGRWRPHVTERRSLEVETDAQAATWAEDLVEADAVPTLQVRAVSPHPPRDDVDTALDAWPAVCSTDLGDRWVFRYSPAVGPLVDRTVGVLGITHEITPEDWLVRFVTADAPAATPGNPSGVFILDDSELDSGDVLAPWTAAPAGWVIV